MGHKSNWHRLAAHVPGRLREGRMAKGYTITELAEAVGVTRQAISQFELGHNTPSGEVFAKIVEKLELPLAYFSNPIENNDPSGIIFFRSLMSTTKRSRDMLSVRSRWLENIYSYLQEFINFPKLNIPDIAVTDFLEPDEIERIALHVRREWGLGMGPISNLILLLEKQGFIVAKANFGDIKTDACSQWIGERPFIFLGSDKESAVRSRLDAAHELGHILLHMWLDNVQFSDIKFHKKIEHEANYFAAAFLLPKDFFADEVMSTSLEFFKTLKKRWKVSIAAMIYRCKDLGIISENQYTYLFRQIGKLKYRKREPFDDELIPESPSMLKKAMCMLIDNKVQTPGDILDALKLNPREIEQLCNLAEGTLALEGKLIQLRFKENSED